MSYRVEEGVQISAVHGARGFCLPRNENGTPILIQYWHWEELKNQPSAGANRAAIGSRNFIQYHPGRNDYKQLPETIMFAVIW